MAATVADAPVLKTADAAPATAAPAAAAAPAAPAAPKVLTRYRFESTDPNGKTLTTYFAKWCGPCKRVSPFVLEFMEGKKDQYTVKSEEILLNDYKIERPGQLIPLLVIGDKVTGTEQVLQNSNWEEIVKPFFLAGEL